MEVYFGHMKKTFHMNSLGNFTGDKLKKLFHIITIMGSLARIVEHLTIQVFGRKQHRKLNQQYLQRITCVKIIPMLLKHGSNLLKRVMPRLTDTLYNISRVVVHNEGFVSRPRFRRRPRQGFSELPPGSSHMITV